MILGKTNILSGSSILESAIPETESDFDFVELCGNFVLDELEVLTRILSETEIFERNTEQDFTNFHILLSHFENSLQGGNFASAIEVTDWNILRREEGELNYTLITTVPNTAVTRYLDIRASSGQNYEYAVQAVSNGTQGNLVESEVVSMSFWGWSLQSLDYDGEGNGTIFFFDTEINTDTIRLNRARNEIETFSQFKKVYRGAGRYRSGGITAFPIECNGENIVEPSTDILNRLDTFIEDGNNKILKNGSGLTLLVDTHDFSWKYRDRLTNQQQGLANTNSQPYDITFKVLEIGEVV